MFSPDLFLCNLTVVSDNEVQYIALFAINHYGLVERLIKIFYIVLQHLSSFTLRTPQETQVTPQERLNQTKVQYLFFNKTVTGFLLMFSIEGKKNKNSS